MTKIRWGVIGAGRIAHQFAKDIAFAPSAVLSAAASRDEARAKAFADQYGGIAWETEYAALIAREDVDAVYIATPHSHHLAHAKAALEAGKPVLCEKPLVLTPDESAELIGVSRDRNVFLMEAMWTWFLPAIVKTKAWVDEGRIGELIQIKADFGYPIAYDSNRREWDAALGGGCLLEMGIYPVGFDRLFNPDAPKAIKAFGQRAENGAESDLTAILEYEGRRSTLGTSFLSRMPNTGYIIGTEGYIAIPDFFRASEAGLFKIDDQIDHFKDDRKAGGFEYEIEAASQDILAGRIENAVMSHAVSQDFQQRMADIKAQF